MTVAVEYKGKKVYLHKSGNLYYFDRKKEGALDEMPEGYEVGYNKKTGFIYPKKVR